MFSTPRQFEANDVIERINPAKAKELLERTLLAGFDPATDAARLIVEGERGQLLAMPSMIPGWAGTKVASVAPGNPEQGLPRIDATYVLMDGEHLRIVAFIDGVALTNLRTPAVTAVAADRLMAPDARRLVVFGTGPQGVGHVEAIAPLRDFETIELVGRDEQRAHEAADELRSRGFAVSIGDADAASRADVIVCATSASEPVLHSEQVQDHACVLAIGSHEPHVRELPGELMGRAQVVVEDVDTALREAGDVVLAIEEGQLHRDSLITLAQLVTSPEEVAVDFSRPRVFKGTGMSWEDLAVASGMVEEELHEADRA